MTQFLGYQTAYSLNFLWNIKHLHSFSVCHRTEEQFCETSNFFLVYFLSVSTHVVACAPQTAYLLDFLWDIQHFHIFSLCRRIWEQFYNTFNLSLVHFLSSSNSCYSLDFSLSRRIWEQIYQTSNFFLIQFP